MVDVFSIAVHRFPFPNWLPVIIDKCCWGSWLLLYMWIDDFKLVPVLRC